MRTMFLVSVLLLFLSACTSNLYLVRHAERLDASSNSPLSESGFERAEALRDTLLGKGIDSIFATTYLRTQQTAAPLATALSKTVVIYGTDTTYQFAQMLRKIKGKDVLVVGHSNTVPEMVDYLTGETVTIGHDDYDNLYLVEISRSLFGVTTRLTAFTFGEPSP